MINYRKKCFNNVENIWILMLISLFYCQKIQAQVGIGTENPRAEAVLDVESENKGIFIPNVDIDDLSSLEPIHTLTATEGLLVFNTNTTTGKGFYYWNGSRWETLGESRTAGMQFYSYSITPVAEPIFSNVKYYEKADKTGWYTGALNLAGAALTSSVLNPGNPDGFVIKLIGYYHVKNPGTFSISSHSDDGARVFVDGTLVINAWNVANSSGNINTGSVNLGKGKHKFEFWYYDYSGNNYLEFKWGANQPDGLQNMFIETSQFTID